jgi:AbrB family looped-hinge helix DNA binding protein
MHSSRITRKGQVTIPVDFPRKFHMEEGDTVYFEEHDDHVAILRSRDIVTRSAGIFNDYVPEGFVFDRQHVWDSIVAEREQVLNRGSAEQTQEKPDDE